MTGVDDKQVEIFSVPSSDFRDGNWTPERKEVYELKAALNRLTKSLAAELYDDGIAVNAASPTNPVATPGAGLLDLAKIDTEDIELITQTAFVLCTGDPKTLTGRIAHTQPFLREIGWLT